MFARLPGSSVVDTARRALAEHTASLSDSNPDAPPTLGLLAGLFSAAPSATFSETFAAGAPVLSLGPIE